MKLNIIFLITLISISAMAAPTLFKEGSINLQAVSIGDSVAADAKSLLDIKSTTKGVLFPRMTTAQMNAISSPPTGLMVWNTTAANLYQYNGSSWIAAGTLSPLTTKGDLYTYSTTNARLGVGTDGYFLQADSTQTTGLKWAPAGLTSQGQSEVSGVTTTTLKVPNNQLTTTGTNERLIETGNGNVMANPSFEHSTVTTGWVTSGASAETTNYLQGAGKKAMKIAASGTGAFLAQNPTLTGNVAGNWEVSLWIRVPSATTATSLQFCLTDTDYSQRLSCLDIQRDGVWKQYKFPSWPAFATIGMAIYGQSVSGDIFVDESYLGPTRNIGTVQQSYNFGTLRQDGATGCGHSVATTNETTWNALGAGSGCAAVSATGSLSNSSANTLQATLTNGGAGSYKVTLGTFFNSSTANLVCNFRFTDGTTPFGILTVYHSSGNNSAGPLVGTLNVSAPFSTKTIYVEASGSNTNACRTLADGAGRMTEWSVEYFPSQSQTVASTPQYEFNETDCASALGSNVTGSWVSNTTYTCKVYRRKNRAYFSVKAATSGAPTSTSLSLTLPVTIDTAKLNTSLFATHIGEMIISDSDTSAYDGPMVYLNSTQVTPRYRIVNTGIVNFTSVTQAAPFTFGSGDYLIMNFDVPVVGWVDNPMPVLVGGVTSSSAGAEKIERVKFTCSSSSSISSQSGPFTVGNISSSLCPVTIASGTFSATPTCTLSVNSNVGLTTIITPLLNVASATSVSVGATFMTSGSNTVSAGTSTQLELICTGPR